MAEELDEMLKEDEEDFEQEAPIKDISNSHIIDPNQEKLLTHTRIKHSLCGSVQTLEPGHAKINLKTTKEMVIDELGLVHSGFIFSAADYAAAAAVNEANLVVIGARVNFLAPAKVEDIIEFEAKAKFEDARKREIHVVGKIKEIKVFEGIFHAVMLDKHIFKVKIKNAKRDYK